MHILEDVFSVVKYQVGKAALFLVGMSVMVIVKVVAG